MNKFSLDLSKFKRIRSDEHTSTLQHKDGHELKIAHKSLSPKLKDQLSQLPMAPQKMADGGMAEKVDELRAQDKDPAYMQAQAEKLGLTDNSAPVQSDTGSIPVPAEYTPGVSNPGPVAQIGNNPSAPQPVDSSQQDAAPASPAPMQAQDAPAPDAQPIQDVAALHKDAHAQLAQDDAHLAHELDSNVITPKTYSDMMGDKGTLGKIGSIFGLMLGGMGAGLTHTENPVTQMWDKIISNDLEKQKSNIGNKLNFLKMSQEEALNKEHTLSLHLGNEQSQMDLARKRANMAALAHLNQLVKSLPPGSPQAIQAQNQLAMAGQFVNAENYRLNDAIAARSAFQQQMMGGADQKDPATQLRSKQVMGFITPQQYEQGNKELEKAMEAEKLRSNLVDSFNDLNGKVLAGKFSPKDRDSAMNAFSGRLAKLSEGRFNMDESKQQIAAIMPDGIESSQTRSNKLMRLHQLMDGQVNTPTLNGLGIRLSKNQSSAPSPQDIKTVNGVKYMRGPNGQAIPVK